VSNGKIFLVDDDSKSLRPLEESGYVAETDLQDLLVDYPDLLPGDQIDPEDPRRWLLVAREMGVPRDEGETSRWSLDHLFLDQDGIPTFVECKRATDTRTRREVVAQMLDYAANGVEYWDVDRIRQSAAETAEKRSSSLDDDVRALLLEDGGQEGDEGVEGFWEAVSDNLTSRQVRLLFVADSIPRELRRLVEFLNEEMQRVEVMAVEIKQYEGPEVPKGCALVPRLIGATEAGRSRKRPRSASRRRTWDSASFFEDVSSKLAADQVEAVRQVFDFAMNRADEISWEQESQPVHLARDSTM
jgi:hypothetical protein